MVPLSKAETKDDLKASFEDIEVYVKVEDKNLRKRTFLSWGASALVHAAALLVAFSLIWAVPKAMETDIPPLRINPISLPIEVKKPDVDIVKVNTTQPIDIEEQTDTDKTTPDLDVQVTTDSSNDDVVVDNVSKGQETAISNVETGSTAFFVSTGAGPGAEGIYGNRGHGDGPRKKGREYGPLGRPVDDAIARGLMWLKKHQDPSGKWDATSYYMNCTEGLKCEPGKDQTGDTDIAMTGYAVLCFLGYGYDHSHPSKYKNVVKKGIDFLIDSQKDGAFGERNYEHFICSQAIFEAYGMTADPALRVACEKALKVIDDRQVKDGKYGAFGWDYTKPNPGRIDASVSGWGIMAAKSALASGLNSSKVLDGGKKWIEEAWKAANPKWKDLTPYDTSIFPYTWSVDGKVDKDYFSFVGACGLTFLNHGGGDTMLETMLNDCDKRWIDSGRYKSNNYASYYVVMSFYQAGGDRWQKCLTTIIPNIISTMNKDTGCFDGSWTFAGQGWHGADTGRVLQTCYNILNLEVAYRYMKIKKK